MRKVVIAIVAGVVAACSQSAGNSENGIVDAAALPDDWTGKPDCGSNTAQKLVAEIAKEHDGLVGSLQWNPSFGDVAASQSQIDQEEKTISALDGSREDVSALPIVEKSAELKSAIGKLAEAESLVQAGYDECVKISDGYTKPVCGNPDALQFFQSPESNSPAARQLDFARTKIVPLATALQEAQDAYREARDAVQQSLKVDRDNKKAALEAKWENAKAATSYSLETIVMTDKNESTQGVSCKATLRARAPGWSEATEDITYTVEVTTDGRPLVTAYGI